MVFAIIPVAYAAAGEVINPVAGIDSVGAIFGILTNLLIGVGVAIVLIFIILAGIRYVMSQGDPKALKQAQDALTWAVAGFVIILLSLFIRNTIARTFGTDINTIESGTGVEVSGGARGI